MPNVFDRASLQNSLAIQQRLFPEPGCVGTICIAALFSPGFAVDWIENKGNLIEAAKILKSWIDEEGPRAEDENREGAAKGMLSCLMAQNRESEQIFPSFDFRGHNLTTLPEGFFSRFLPGVRHINLYGNKLASLPKDIKQLKSLRELDLSNNQLPSFSISKNDFPSLIKLDLDQNLLTSFFVEEGALQEIKTLSLQYNYDLRLETETALVLGYLLNLTFFGPPKNPDMELVESAIYKVVNGGVRGNLWVALAGRDVPHSRSFCRYGLEIWLSKLRKTPEYQSNTEGFVQTIGDILCYVESSTHYAHIFFGILREPQRTPIETLNQIYFRWQGKRAGFVPCTSFPFPSLEQQLDAQLDAWQTFGDKGQAVLKIKRLFNASPNNNRSLLDLDLLSLTTVPVEALSFLPNLEILSMTNNDLTTIPENLGAYAPSLKNLDLSYNRLESFPLAPLLQGCQHLTTIGLNHNRSLSQLPILEARTAVTTIFCQVTLLRPSDEEVLSAAENLIALEPYYSILVNRRTANQNLQHRAPVVRDRWEKPQWEVLDACIKNDPESLLLDFLESGFIEDFPQITLFDENTERVRGSDAGGIGRHVQSALFEALFDAEKRKHREAKISLVKDEEGCWPMIGEGQEARDLSLYRAVGRLMGFAYKGKTHEDTFVTGPYFNPRIFDVIASFAPAKHVADDISAEEFFRILCLLKPSLYELSLKAWAGLKLSPDEIVLLKLVEEAEELDLEAIQARDAAAWKEALCKYDDQLPQIIKAICTIAQGMKEVSGIDWQLIHRGTSEEFREKIEGKLDYELVRGAIRWNEIDRGLKTEDVERTKEWLMQWLEEYKDKSLEEIEEHKKNMLMLKTFVQVVTGGFALRKNGELKVQLCAREQLPAAHTCFNTLDLSTNNQLYRKDRDLRNALDYQIFKEKIELFLQEALIAGGGFALA